MAPIHSEVVYIASDGEFIREAFARQYARRCGGLPERIKLERWANQLKELGFSRWSATFPPEVIERAFKTVEFTGREFGGGDGDISNPVIADNLRDLGYVNPRRYPVVEFFVNDLCCWPSYEWSPVGRNGGNQWCHLVTNGDREDLHRFAASLGLDRTNFVDQGDDLWRYDLTPSKRRKAVAYGAQETRESELRVILRARDAHQL